MTVQDMPDLAGAIVYDCRPPLLPVSLRLMDIGLLPRSRPVASASLAAPPPEDPMVIGDASPEGVAVREFGVAPLDSPGTDLDDELPTPEDSVMIGGSSPERVAIPEIGVAPPTAECVAIADYRVVALATYGGPSDVPVVVSRATCAGSAGPCPQCRVAGCSTPGGGRPSDD